MQEKLEKYISLYFIQCRLSFLPNFELTCVANFPSSENFGLTSNSEFGNTTFYNIHLLFKTRSFSTKTQSRF